jgi:hypothetical protein
MLSTAIARARHGMHRNLILWCPIGRLTRKTHNMPRTWAQTAIIPKNNVMDAKAAASSTTERNMTTSPKRTNKEHNSLFVLLQGIFWRLIT